MYYVVYLVGFSLSAQEISSPSRFYTHTSSKGKRFVNSQVLLDYKSFAISSSSIPLSSLSLISTRMEAKEPQKMRKNSSETGYFLVNSPRTLSACDTESHLPQTSASLMGHCSIWQKHCFKIPF